MAAKLGGKWCYFCRPIKNPATHIKEAVESLPFFSPFILIYSILMINPKHALLVGGALYGCGVAYMVNNYYKRSSFRQIYLKADQNYEKVKIMHPPTQATV